MPDPQIITNIQIYLNLAINLFQQQIPFHVFLKPYQSRSFIRQNRIATTDTQALPTLNLKQQYVNIILLRDTTFQFIGELTKNLSKHVEPKVKVNTLSTLCKFLSIANYPVLLLAEIYLMPYLQKVVDYAVQNNGFHNLVNYFKMEGYNTSIPHLQNLSYNFVTKCCQFIQFAASIKPYKVYQGKEYSDISIFKKCYQKLTKSTQQIEPFELLYQHQQIVNFRQKYLQSLQEWEQYEDRLISFYINIFEHYINTGTQPKIYQISFIDTLKYGQPSITSQIIARTIDIAAYSQNFKIRIRSLKLLDSFVIWGDIQALIVINCTEHIQKIIKNIWCVKGNLNLDEGRNIYPQIQGQLQDKLQFYKLFLVCIQKWAQIFPTNETYANISHSQQQSVVYKLYRLLKDKKRFIFPINISIPQYEKQCHKHLLDKMIRNLMILQDINRQPENASADINQNRSLKEVQLFYQTHKQCLLQIINKGEEDLHPNMNKLKYFKQYFEKIVQTIDINQQQPEQVDKLIENGLQLIDLINSIHLPYIQFLKHQYNFLQFKQIVTNLCINYFYPEKQQQSAIKTCNSEQIRKSKNQLKSINMRQQLSIPEIRQLKKIINNINIKQLRSKYRQKIDKTYYSRTSENSFMDLQIFTKKKISKEVSRDQYNDSSINSVGEPVVSLKQLLQNKKKKIKNQRLSVKNSRNVFDNPQQQQNKQNKHSSKQKISPRFSLDDPPNTITSNYARKQTLQKVESQTDDTNHINKINQQQPQQHNYYNVKYSQNSIYYSFLQEQRFKFSYVYPHIIIFKSDYLVVERQISQIVEEGRIKVKIQIILIPILALVKPKFQIQNQGSILIQDRTRPFPEMLLPVNRYCIQLVGTMNKLPLKLPTFAFFLNNYPILQYILPYTINFFLDCYSNESQVLYSFKNISPTTHYCLFSDKFDYSPVLFPNINNLFIFFPFILKLSKIGDDKDLFLWQVKYQGNKFLLAFQQIPTEKAMTVRLFSSLIQNQHLHSFFKYLVNWFVHLFSNSNNNKH